MSRFRHRPRIIKSEQFGISYLNHRTVLLKVAILDFTSHKPISFCKALVLYKWFLVFNIICIRRRYVRTISYLKQGQNYVLYFNRYFIAFQLQLALSSSLVRVGLNFLKETMIQPATKKRGDLSVAFETMRFLVRKLNFCDSVIM